MSKKKNEEITSDLDANRIIEEKSEKNNNKKTDDKIKSKRNKMMELLAEDDEAANDEETYKLEEIKSVIKKNTDKIKSGIQNIGQKSSVVSKKMGFVLSGFAKNAKETAYNINIKIKKAQKNGDLKEIFRQNSKTVYMGLLVFIISIAAYGAYYSQIPLIQETHNPDIKGVIASYDGDSHPFEILSSNRDLMLDFKGEPNSKGDGKTLETKYVVYKLEWFGKIRETILFYDDANHFTRIKLNIGNESAKDLVSKLTENFGMPVEDKEATTKGGYAIWIKDSVQYKLVHHGSYATIEMKVARYDNTNKLEVGAYPVVIQKLYKLDINEDENLESLILLGNKKNSLSTNYDKLYLLLWDGKTHLVNMADDFEGGAYPQVEFKDLDKDGKSEIIIYSDNNGVVRNYNVFKYDGAELKLTYSGYEEPQEQN